MKKIPLALVNEIKNDPFYNQCCISGKSQKDTKIDWHHNLIFAGSQVNEKWCILPLARDIHDRITFYKEKCDWIMLNRASIDDLKRYSKAIDYLSLKEKLNKKYGEYCIKRKLL